MSYDASELDVFASEFARKHGEFSLHFDAAQNYVRPDDAPWSVEVKGKEFGGFTALNALQFADEELSRT